MEGSNSTLSQELANWLADLRTQWSGKIEQPLKQPVVFLYAFLGASTIVFSLAFEHYRTLLQSLLQPQTRQPTSPSMWRLYSLLFGSSFRCYLRL